MSENPSMTLLWVNKDATNVHRKKHISEVNAHVQKRNSKKRDSKKHSPRDKNSPPSQRDGGTGRLVHAALRECRSSSSSPASEETLKAIVLLRQQRSDHEVNEDPCPETPYIGSLDQSDREKPVIFSSYVEDNLQQYDVGLLHDKREFPSDSQLAELTQQLEQSWPTTLDVSNPLPGLITNLSSHDKMLVHTHLTYMPSIYYGYSNRSVYCPIRTASVTNMIKSPVGTMWVLICLEMFLETARGSNDRKTAILRRKNCAYQMMSKSLTEHMGESSDNEDSLIGLTAAAITEMFCGDYKKALTHLQGLDAFITAKGGLEYVKKMDLAVSMPMFAVLAYRTLFQDNLPTQTVFQRSRDHFVAMFKSLISWNRDVIHIMACSSTRTAHTFPHDEGFDGNYDLNEGIEEFRATRQRSFTHHPLLNRFITTNLIYSKPGEKVDHFLLLYNLNIALMDHGDNFKRANQFLKDFVDDVETGGSSRTHDSSINVSGVLRLLTHRQARMFQDVSPTSVNTGIARAWEALQALDIMKLLCTNMQKSVIDTLYGLLVDRRSGIMSEENLRDIEGHVTREWCSRHHDTQPYPPG